MSAKNDTEIRSGPKCKWPEYSVWTSMIQRCTNKNTDGFKHYGGRGIKVCDKWRSSFEEFVRDVGFRPSMNHSINRIDNDGNYEPGNCEWATKKKQNRNTRRSHLIEFKGVKKCLTDWAEEFGMSQQTLYERIVILKWDVEKAMTEPTINAGERHHRSKLTEPDIREIRELSKSITHGEISKKFGVDRSRISAIVRRESWSHVK